MVTVDECKMIDLPPELQTGLVKIVCAAATFAVPATVASVGISLSLAYSSNRHKDYESIEKYVSGTSKYELACDKK